VTGNSGGLGGGIDATVELTLERSSVEGNTADATGGGISAVGGSIRDSTITGNTSNGGIPVGGGDAVIVYGGVPFTVANSTIDHGSRTSRFALHLRVDVSAAMRSRCRT
jgi:hypothetical protein